MGSARILRVKCGYVVEDEYVNDGAGLVLWGTHYYGLTPEPWHFTAIMVRP